LVKIKLLYLKPGPKKSQNSQKSKRKTFSFDFKRKIKNSLRRKTFSPIPIRSKSPNQTKSGNQNIIKEIPLADSGIVLNNMTHMTHI